MQWHNATQRLTKLLLEIKALQQDVTAIDSVLDEESARLAVMDAQRDEAGANTGCDIGQISGDVSVQTQTIAPGATAFSDSEASDIKRRLRDPLAIRERLFRGNSGKYSWYWKPAAEET